MSLTAFQILYIYVFSEFCDIKIQIKVTIYHNGYGAIQWPVSTSVKIVLANFKFSRYCIFIYCQKFCDVENVEEDHRLQHSPGAVRWQMSDLLSDGNSNVCYISH